MVLSSNTLTKWAVGHREGKLVNSLHSSLLAPFSDSLGWKGSPTSTFMQIEFAYRSINQPISLLGMQAGMSVIRHKSLFWLQKQPAPQWLAAPTVQATRAEDIGMSDQGRCDRWNGWECHMDACDFPVRTLWLMISTSTIFLGDGLERSPVEV